MKARHRVLLLLFLAGIINYLDRSALSVAAPLIAKDLDLSPSDLGFVFSSFFIGYTVFNFVGGWASDHLGGKRVYALAMAGWSLFCGLTAAAAGFQSLLAVRIVFGMGEGPLSATNNKIVHTWFPRREAAGAVGIANCGTPLGGAIAGPVVGFLALAYGWRVAFVAAGLVGFAWLLVWQRAVSEAPSRSAGVSPREMTEIETVRGSPDRPEAAQPLAFYLVQPTVLATALAFFGYNYVLYFFLTWFPSYLTSARHLGLKDMSLATVLPWLLGFIGLGLSGILTDMIFRRTGRPLEARKLVLVVSLGIAGLSVILAGLVTTTAAALALMSCTVFFLYLSGGTYWAIIQDTVEGGRLGGVSGFVHALANSSGIVGPAATGLLVERTGSFTSAFVLAGTIAAFGVLGVLMFVRPIDASAPKAVRDSAAGA